MRAQAAIKEVHVAAPVVELTAILKVFVPDMYIMAPLLPLTPNVGSPAYGAPLSEAGAAMFVNTGAARLADAVSGGLSRAMPAALRVAAATAAGSPPATPGTTVGRRGRRDRLVPHPRRA